MILVASLAGVLAACDNRLASAVRDTGSLTGTVIKYGLDEHSGIFVELPGLETRTTTDPTGFFELAGVPVGRWDVVIDSSGFGTLAMQGLAVLPGDNDLGTILLPRGRRLVAATHASIIDVSDTARLIAVQTFGERNVEVAIWALTGELIAQTEAQESVVWGTFSPDGWFFTFVDRTSEESEVGPLVLFDVATTTWHRFGTFVHPFSRDVSPEGRTVAYVETDSDAPPNPCTGRAIVQRLAVGDSMELGQVDSCPPGQFSATGGHYVLETVDNADQHALSLWDLRNGIRSVLSSTPLAGAHGTIFDPSDTRMVYFEGANGPGSLKANLVSYDISSATPAEVASGVLVDSLLLDASAGRCWFIEAFDEATGLGALSTYDLLDGVKNVELDGVGSRYLVLSPDQTRMLLRSPYQPGSNAALLELDLGSAAITTVATDVCHQLYGYVGGGEHVYLSRTGQLPGPIFLWSRSDGQERQLGTGVDQITPYPPDPDAPAMLFLDDAAGIDSGQRWVVWDLSRMQRIELNLWWPTGQPRLSPDGARVILASNEIADGSGPLSSFDLATRQTTPIHPHVRPFDVAFAAGNLLYRVCDLSTTRSAWNGIYLTPLD
jgi:hypothetical protein